MSFLKLNGSVCVLFVALAMVVASSQLAMAETLTLKCNGGNMVYVIDLSGGTVIGKASGYTFNYTDVAISDSTISFVQDMPNSERRTFQIDRTTGSISVDNFYYPNSGTTGPARGVSQCTKIPDKAF